MFKRTTYHIFVTLVLFFGGLSANFPVSTASMQTAQVQTTPERREEALRLLEVGAKQLEKGYYQPALTTFVQALVITKAIDDKILQARTINNIGYAYEGLGQYSKALDTYQQALAIRQSINDEVGQYPKALDFYQQALAIRKEIGDKLGQGVTLNNIGFAYIVQRQFPEAEKHLFAAIDVWESMRSRLTDDQKISIFEPQAATYRFLQQALIAQNKNNMALEIAERGRAKAFVELLRARLSPNPEFQPQVTIPNIKQIQQVAWQQKATLVEYSVNKSQLYIWVVKPNGEVKFQQKDLTFLNTPLKEFVENSRLAIGVGGRGINVVPNNRKQQEHFYQLYQLLIEPIASYLPTNPEEHVIFIPHESLFLVPFPALRDTNGKYLIEKHTIITAPAIQILELTHQQRQNHKATDVLVVGNPTMPKVGVPPAQLRSLPGAEKEAKTIAQFFKTKALIGKEATKTTVLQSISRAKIIHLATHGLLDGFGERVPGAVVLTPTSSLRQQGTDGLLRTTEIVDLKLNADLVVLSACDTGRGNITGDGVIGLSRALLGAGARSVVVSLWSVPDTPTAELMTEFYRQWLSYPNKAKALRNAMLVTMKKHPEPKNWAAFTLIGEAN